MEHIKLIQNRFQIYYIFYTIKRNSMGHQFLYKSVVQLGLQTIIFGKKDNPQKFETYIIQISLICHFYSKSIKIVMPNKMFINKKYIKMINNVTCRQVYKELQILYLCLYQKIIYYSFSPYLATREKLHPSPFVSLMQLAQDQQISFPVRHSILKLVAAKRNN